MHLTIRQAKESDAPRLTEIAFAAKRHWQYPEEWIRLWSSQLTLTPEFVRDQIVYCADAEGSVMGFYALVQDAEGWEIEHMWVDPLYIGKGLGGQLLRHAQAQARHIGAQSLNILSDPNAVGFYAKAGARKIGEVAATPPGRMLPLMRLNL